MRLVIPAGAPRWRAAALGAVLVLGWLSGVGEHPLGGDHGRPAPHRSAANANAQRPARSGWPALLAIVAVHHRVDCRRAKCVALTFDDGPGPYTARLLDILAAHRAKVTFFLIGRNIRGREALVRRELAEGHAVGAHTWSHPDLTGLSTAALWAQNEQTVREIERAAGFRPTIMRPPYGATNKRVGKAVRRLGLAQIIWDVDTNDWRDRNSRIVARRASRADRGDIVLMHDIHPTTVDAVPKILTALARRGFTFVTVPELLAAHPLRPGRVYFSGSDNTSGDS